MSCGAAHCLHEQTLTEDLCTLPPLSSGLDAIGRVWDARTGRAVWVLDGHVKQITALDWSPNGYQLATGSADDSVKIWDIRKLACTYTIPAHKSLVSDIKFFRAANERPSLPSTNGTISLSEASTPAAAADSEMQVDGEPAAPVAASSSSSILQRSGLYLVTGGYDSTVKIWSSDDWQLLRTVVTDSQKVMGIDVDPEGKFFVAGSSNRNFQLLGTEGSL